MKYQELLQRRADLEQERDELIAKAEAILEGAGAELSEEQKSAWDELDSQIEAKQDKIDDLNTDIKRVEKQRDRRRLAAASREPQPYEVEISGIRDRVEDDPRLGFESLAEFSLAVRQASIPGGNFDDRLRPTGQPTDFHRESGSSEGYMVPPEFRQTIWEVVFEGDDILNMVDIEPTGSNSVELLADETTPWGSSGVQANWRNEGTKMDPSKLDTDGRNVPLHQLYAFVLATEDLLADAPRLSDRLTRQAGRAIRWKTSDAFVWGTGAGQPLGWMNSDALVTVAKEDAQSDETIVAMNVAKMYSRALSMGIRNAFWLVNNDALPQLMTMELGDQPIWTPPNGFVDAPGGILLGRPVQLSEHAETVGNVGDIQLILPAGYYATQRQNSADFATSIHLYFDYGIEAFRWTFRFGGQPFLSSPVEPARGTNTRSHFVTLAARSS